MSDYIILVLGLNFCSIDDTSIKLFLGVDFLVFGLLVRFVAFTTRFFSTLVSDALSQFLLYIFLLPPADKP
jgi:hypothetical protein